MFYPSLKKPRKDLITNANAIRQEKYCISLKLKGHFLKHNLAVPKCRQDEITILVFFIWVGNTSTNEVDFLHKP